MKVYTIGYLERTSDNFYKTLRQYGVQRLIDVRLFQNPENTNFAKAVDLERSLTQHTYAKYFHEPLLAPTEELLHDYFQKGVSWKTYEKRYLEILKGREVEARLSKEIFSPTSALLCAEHEPDHCHRRLALEYLRRHWGDLEIIHLMR